MDKDPHYVERLQSQMKCHISVMMTDKENQICRSKNKEMLIHNCVQVSSLYSLDEYLKELDVT